MMESRVVTNSNEDCFLANPRFAYTSSRRTFCAESLEISQVCYGDYGHGMFIRYKGRFYLKRIMSSFPMDGRKCDFSTYSIYTNIFKFGDWIEMNGKKIFLFCDGTKFFFISKPVSVTLNERKANVLRV